MKNVFLLLLTIPLLIVSCGDDKDYENILDGTTWTRHVPESQYSFEMDEEFHFSKSTGSYYITQKENGEVVYSEDFDFSYRFEGDNKIILSVFNETSEALIEGRKMRFVTGYEDEQPIFTKKE